MVLMSCSGVLSFSKFSVINVFDLFVMLLLSCSHILQKYLFIASAMPWDSLIITSSSTTEVILVVLDRLLINLFIVPQVSFRFPAQD